MTLNQRKQLGGEGRRGGRTGNRGWYPHRSRNREERGEEEKEREGRTGCVTFIVPRGKGHSICDNATQYIKIDVMYTIDRQTTTTTTAVVATGRVAMGGLTGGKGPPGAWAST